jgi:4-hydroxy-3-polyprenylbenzoate decarboxylase
VTGRPRVVLGVTGASGATLAVRILERLAALDRVELHLVISSAARRTLAHEVGPDGFARMESLALRTHAPEDVGASIASGSFATAGMIVAPCSMNSLAAIAAGLAHNLIIRAADVHLKERRRLVLLPREAPLHLGHLRNLCTVAELGAVILPPVPAFYYRPNSIEEMVDQIAARAIDLLELPVARQGAAWQG